MKIAYLLDWTPDIGQLISLEDGLFEALRLISLNHDLRVHTLGFDTIIPHKYFPVYCKKTPEEMADFILNWKPDRILVLGDFTRPTIPLLTGRGIEIFQLFSGGIDLGEPPKGIDLFLVESKCYERWFKERGLPVKIGFGVNDRLFRPIQQPKVWDAIFPATYANWKRHKLFSDSLSDLNCFTCGYMYDDHEVYCYKYPQSKNIGICSHIPASALVYLYNMAKTCVITSDRTGGSQRTVLEAMACNIPVIAMDDSDKTSEYVNECGVGEVVPPDNNAIKEAVLRQRDKVGGRDYILSKWTAKQYAEVLLTRS